MGCEKWGLSCSLSRTVGVLFAVIDSWECAGSTQLPPASLQDPAQWYLGSEPQVDYPPWWLLRLSSFWGHEPDGAMWEPQSHSGLSGWHLSPSAGTDTCSDSLLQMLTEGDVALEWALSFAWLFWKEGLSLVWCCWLRIKIDFWGCSPRLLLSLIFPLEDRSIWPISQVLWQPLKFLKQSKQTDTQIHNTKLI